MSKTLWRKKIIGGTMCLVPDCVDAAEWLNKTKLEQGVMIEPRRPRNIGHHKKLFALLNLAVQNWPTGDIDTETLLGAIKIKTGHCTELKTKSGVMQIPKSINFESMDQIEFSPFYKQAVTIISKVLGVTPEDLEQESRAA